MTNKKRLGRTTAWYGFVVLFLGATVDAGLFEISWYTIDGGGVMRSTNGDLELSGTIGQPDAGVMSGGDFELTGGFWFALSPGDCNTDGGVNLLDHNVFEGCLSGPDGPVPVGDCRCFDVDQSGSVDLADFAVIIETFSAG